MTNAELQELLARYPPTADVVFYDEEMALFEESTNATVCIVQINESGALEHTRPTP